MLVWLTLPFYDFCGFRSVAVNSVYKLQFLTFIVVVVVVVEEEEEETTGMGDRVRVRLPEAALYFGM